MQVTHLRTNDQNESEFGTVEISLERSGAEQYANLPTPDALILNETDIGHDYPWHNAPQRQWVVTLQGEIEVRLRNGESKRFGAGSLILADDINGSGHATSVTSKDPWRCLYIPFNGDL